MHRPDGPVAPLGSASDQSARDGSGGGQSAGDEGALR
jgi:hypothetical protein